MAILYRCKTPTDWLCPCGKCARRLRAAGVSFDEVRVPVLKRDRDEVDELTGQRWVPVLVHGDEVVTDSHRIVEYDRRLGDDGFHHGAGTVMTMATAGMTVRGGEHVPADGPLLVVANHPGLSDAVSILAALGRDDAWVVAADYPFLHALRRANARFVFVSDERTSRLAALRRIGARLRRGGLGGWSLGDSHGGFFDL